jgi:hypothetical protein
MRLASSEIKQEIERKRSELNEMKHTAQHIEQSDSDETNERNVQKVYTTSIRLYLINMQKR